MKIGIIGRKKDTGNYERFLSQHQIPYLTTLNLGEYSSCSAFLFPGGGDMNPAFFGERNSGSVNIDTELDILQLQAFDYAYDLKRPILGICKGMQLINVALGGTLFQNIPTAGHHQYIGKDQYHDTRIESKSFLHTLYGDGAYVNSAHHQSVKKLGIGLEVIQWCSFDNCIEGIVGTSRPIIGLQWHPERLDSNETRINALPLLKYFLSLQ